MKKLLVVALVLSLAALANATVVMNLTVGGTDAGDEITLAPSGNLTIGISGDVPANEYTGVWLLAAGPGTLTGGTISSQAQEAQSSLSPTGIIPDSDPAQTWGDFMASIGYENTFAIYQLEYVDSVEPFGGITGILFSGAAFHCEGTGDVTIAIVDYAGDELLVRDTLVIHQIPEPMTMGLLGLGGLFLRRRK